MFCKTCSSLLIPRTTPYGKWMSCPQGHSQPEVQQESKTTIQNNPLPGKHIEVMDGENRLAVYTHRCKRCGHDLAELLEISASYSDEDNTYRMKCGKCGQVEQLEGKVR